MGSVVLRQDFRPVWAAPAAGTEDTAGIGFRTVIGGNAAAVIAVSAICIQCGVAGTITSEVQRASIDGERTVGVNAVSL